MGAFQINGRRFSPNRVDTRVKLGSVEDGEIQNLTFMDHPSPIHVRPFQLAGADGIVDPAMRDVINVVRGLRGQDYVPLPHSGS